MVAIYLTFWILRNNSNLHHRYFDLFIVVFSTIITLGCSLFFHLFTGVVIIALVVIIIISNLSLIQKFNWLWFVLIGILVILVIHPINLLDEIAANLIGENDLWSLSQKLFLFVQTGAIIIICLGLICGIRLISYNYKKYVMIYGTYFILLSVYFMQLPDTYRIFFLIYVLALLNIGMFLTIPRNFLSLSFEFIKNHIMKFSESHDSFTKHIQKYVKIDNYSLKIAAIIIIFMIAFIPLYSLVVWYDPDYLPNRWSNSEYSQSEFDACVWCNENLPKNNSIILSDPGLAYNTYRFDWY